MGMQYIRDVYKVPAKRGGQVRYTDGSGKTWTGRIKSARGPYLRVAFSGFPRATAIMHPTWNLEYLEARDEYRRLLAEQSRIEVEAGL